jgi:Holliday junction resolvase RusA-like endonuclease
LRICANGLSPRNCNAMAFPSETTETTTENTLQSTFFTTHNYRTMVYWVEEMFEVEDSKGSTLSFIVTGNPPTQERARMNWKNQDHPTIYHPSSSAKKCYGLVVKQAMVDIGLSAFPYLSGVQPVTLEVHFFLPRRKQDIRIVQGTALGSGEPVGPPVYVLTSKAQAYPVCKDVDNLLKFVMDALEKIVYKDDSCVVSSLATKEFPPLDQSNSKGWAEVHISVPNPT